MCICVEAIYALFMCLLDSGHVEANGCVDCMRCLKESHVVHLDLGHISWDTCYCISGSSKRLNSQLVQFCRSTWASKYSNERSSDRKILYFYFRF